MAYAQKYASSAGGGLHDGSSEANAWAFSEILTNAVAGDYVNYKNDNHTVPTASAMTNTGTYASHITIAAYKTTPGDLDGLGRNSDTSLNTTDFPTLTLSGTFPIATSFIVFQNFIMSGTYPNEMIGAGPSDKLVFINCEFRHTVDSAFATTIRCDDQLNLINCDMYISGGSFSNLVRADYHGYMKGCRFIVSGTTANYLFRVNTVVMSGCIISGNENDIVNLNNTLYLSVLEENTFYDCGDILRLPNAAPNTLPIMINNHGTDSYRWINNQYSATSDIALIEVNNRTRDITIPRTGVGAGVLLGEVTADTGGPETDYTDYVNNDLTLKTTAAGKDAALGVANP